MKRKWIAQWNFKWELCLTIHLYPPHEEDYFLGNWSLFVNIFGCSLNVQTFLEDV